VNLSSKSKDDLYVVIIGCGRLGALLAARLSASGNAVVILDRDPDAFSELPPEFSGFRVEGDASQTALLRQAKTGQADVLIATTHDDNLNLMVAQVAKEVFHVPKVMARVFDPSRGAVYEGFGIDTVCPTSIAASAFLDALGADRPRTVEGTAS